MRIVRLKVIVIIASGLTRFYYNIANLSVLILFADYQRDQAFLQGSTYTYLDPSCNKYCNLIGHCECSILLRKPCNHLENHVTT